MSRPARVGVTRSGPVRCVVTSVTWPTPRMARVAIHSPGLVGIQPTGPDQRVKLAFPAGRTFSADPEEAAQARRRRRTYTLLDLDPSTGEAAIEFVVHGEGLAGPWARSAQAGDELDLTGPVGSFDLLGSAPRGPGSRASSRVASPAVASGRAGRVDSAGLATGEPEPSGERVEPIPASAERTSEQAAGIDPVDLLLACDESGLPAARAILAQLDPRLRAQAFVEVHDPGEQRDLPSRAQVEATWLSRSEHPGALAGELLAGLAETVDVPPGARAWVAGEAGAVRRLRTHLLATVGLARHQVSAVAYWTRGHAEGGPVAGRPGERRTQAGLKP